MHGRRRAGTGRDLLAVPAVSGERHARLIDWRRSASSDHLYVREREWEAAHTFWLWPDISPSMDFRSHLAHDDQARPRAGADAGRRRAAGARRRARRPARADAADGQPQGDDAHRRDASPPTATPTIQNASLPPKARLVALFGRLLFSDFLDPPDDDRAQRIERAGRRRRQPAISSQILDPAEETLPYEGRTEFLGPEGGERWVADRVETLRTAIPRNASPRIAPSSSEIAASGSAGRSWCITPTGRQPSRCSR